MYEVYEAEMLMKERTKAILREAERERLGRMVNSARPGLLSQALVNIGGLLISIGKKLQARHALLQAGFKGFPSPASQ